jgi:hypothetical protein
MTADHEDLFDASVARGYEVRDATVWVLVLFGLGLCVALVFTLLGSGLLASYLKVHQPGVQAASTTAAPAERPPKPRLEINPQMDLAAKRRAEDATLNSYGWIDRNTGTVRIPIERAMDLVAERSSPSKRP